MRCWLAFVCLAAACSSSPAEPDADPGPDTTGETFSVSIGPITVPPGGENTQCVEKKLGNIDHKWISKIHTTLTGVSHHVIVYRVTSTTERPDPFDCTPFLETLDPATGSPIMVTQIAQETLDLPYGVALGMDPDQMIRLEMHFINPGEVDADVKADVVFDVLPEEQFREEAGFLFIGNPDIQIPAMSQFTLGPTWFPMPSELADIKVFGMTGHTHRWGTNVQVEYLPEGEGGAAMPVYDFPQWNWEEPPVVQFHPALDMPPNAGFRFTCSWNNQSPVDIGFGESANDEMCFFWSYYYPTQGHKVCAHTDQLGVPINVCCPGPDAICDQILDYLHGNM